MTGVSSGAEENFIQTNLHDCVNINITSKKTAANQLNLFDDDTTQK